MGAWCGLVKASAPGTKTQAPSTLHQMQTRAVFVRGEEPRGQV